VEALEERWVPSSLWTVTSSADDVNQVGTLRWAVAQAHDLDTIEIFSDPGSVRFIGLTHGELILNHSVTIETAPDSQVIISGQNLSRIFEIGREAYVNLDNPMSLSG
jgi:hypothetical protein